MRTKQKATDRKDYSGDVNLEYGGTFFDFSDWQYGYVSAVRVTDLDSACGFDGAVLIERITINGTDDVERVRESFASCGWLIDGEQMPGLAVQRAAEGDRQARMMIADALMGYGHYDPDDMDYSGDAPKEIVQTDMDAPMSRDGWTANKRVMCADLPGYVLSMHVDWTDSGTGQAIADADLPVGWTVVDGHRTKEQGS